MMIEVDLSIAGLNHAGEEETREWKTIFNADQMNYIGTVNNGGLSYLEFHTGGTHFRYRAFTEENNIAVYQALKFALQGRSVKLEGWGHISPLIDSHEYWNQRRMFAKDIICEVNDLL